jgi:hypothetical protein
MQNHGKTPGSRVLSDQKTAYRVERAPGLARCEILISVASWQFRQTLTVAGVACGFVGFAFLLSIFLMV